MSDDSQDKANGEGLEEPVALAVEEPAAEPVVRIGDGVSLGDGVVPLGRVLASGAAGDTAAWPAPSPEVIRAALAVAEAAARPAPPLPLPPTSSSAPPPPLPMPTPASAPISLPPIGSLPKPPLPDISLTDSVDDLPPPMSVPVPQPFAPLKVIPAPHITEVDVAEGTVLGETRVTLRGDHLLRYSIVRFGGELARPIGAREPSEIRVATPPGARAGQVSITVQNPGSEEVEVSQKFRYLPLPPPHISSVAPVRVGVAGGAEITISGSNFVRASVVLVDGQPALDSTFVDAETIDFIASPGTAGKTADVVVRNPDGRSDEAPRAYAYDSRY